MVEATCYLFIYYSVISNAAVFGNGAFGILFFLRGLYLEIIGGKMVSETEYIMGA